MSTSETVPNDSDSDPLKPQQPPPWEPPVAGDEQTHLLAMLERLRATFRWKVDGLDDHGLRATIGASSLTLAGLLKHLSRVEALKFSWDAFGRDPGDPWRSVDWDETPLWDFETALEDAPDELYGRYDQTVRRSRQALAAAIAEGGLDQPIRMVDNDGTAFSLRRIVCDLIEEYGRHTGHADLLREAVDGRVGEDPPWDWRPFE